MPITPDQDTLVLDRRCVAAFFHGTEEALRRTLALGSVDISLADIRVRAIANIDAWRMNDFDKTTCYLCSAPFTPGSLCACFQAVMPTRYFNVHDFDLLAKLPASTVVETFSCDKCGCLEGVTAEIAKKSCRATERYVARTTCTPCHKAAQAVAQNTKRLEAVVRRQERIMVIQQPRQPQPRQEVPPQARREERQHVRRLEAQPKKNPWAPPVAAPPKPQHPLQRLAEPRALPQGHRRAPLPSAPAWAVPAAVVERLREEAAAVTSDNAS